jgi:hypothetical protein
MHSPSIHQHEEKNSFPLKEVLTAQSGCARFARRDNIASRSQDNAQNAGVIDALDRRECRKQLYCSVFCDSHNARAMRARDCRTSRAGTEGALRGLRVAIFGNEKIFMLNVIGARQLASKGIVVANHDQ